MYEEYDDGDAGHALLTQFEPSMSGEYDGDTVKYEPDPARVRNILTMDERVRAIQAYDEKPMYTKVAKMFNCGWEQIKNIVANRDSIMRYHASRQTGNMPYLGKVQHPYRSPNVLSLEQRVRVIKAFDRNPKYKQLAKIFNCGAAQIRRIILNREEILSRYATSMAAQAIEAPLTLSSEIDFIDECVAEFIMRVHHYRKRDITEEYIRQTANKFREMLKVENFSADKSWMSKFKMYYKSSLANRKMYGERVPPASLEFDQIIEFCLKKSNKTESFRTLQNKNEARKRKTHFLECVLVEYIERVKFHQNREPREAEIINTAGGLKQILKIDGFDPNLHWVREFRQFQLAMSSDNRTHKPPTSLDLKDIISYCSRMNMEKKRATPAPSQPKEEFHHFMATPDNSNFDTILPDGVELDDDYDSDYDEDDVIDIEDAGEPPLKIKKIQESVNESQYESGERSFRNFLPVSPPVLNESAWQQDSTNLVNQLDTYDDALKLLKPLEEFAMLKANYRAIGLLTQLEEIFKNPPKEDDFQEEN